MTFFSRCKCRPEGVLDGKATIRYSFDCPKVNHQLLARDDEIHRLRALFQLVDQEVLRAAVHSNPRLIGQHILNARALLENYKEENAEARYSDLNQYPAQGTASSLEKNE